MSLGKKIQKRREELGLSRDELATYVKISKGYLKGIETGQVKPGIKCVFKIALILEMSLGELLGGDDNNRL
ncbi:MAG: hypothetical protein AWM53_01535 [Candidatus Dichloromethanomonas elyunquensis]|nr:MAG: hypothetical protein AWM53_01535 [Candidatus Dichloromethanomonas elyunquensis]